MPSLLQLPFAYPELASVAVILPISPEPSKKMAGVTKKRRRAPTSTNPDRPPKKKLVQEEDEEILSDEVGSLNGDISESESESESEPENETTEEKRLRLARVYLRHEGISENAAYSEDEGYDSDKAAENDAANKFLRDAASQKAGKSVKYIADSVAKICGKVSMRKCKGHSLPPTCVALSRDGETTAVSGGKDARLIVWDVETGRQKYLFKPTVTAGNRRNPALSHAHLGGILAVAITDDANLVVSAGTDCLIRVWDVRSGKSVTALQGHRKPIHGLAFRAGTRQLFSASQDRTVKMWDMEDMGYMDTLFGHGAEVNSITSLAMNRALSCGRDGSLRLYKIQEESQLVFKRASTVSIDTVTMLNENRFISGGDDGAVCLWQTNKKKPVAVMEHAHGEGLGCDKWISAIEGFRYTDLVASGAGDGVVRLWKCEDVPKIVPVGTIDVGPGFVNAIATGARNRVMAVAVGAEHRLGRWSRVKKARNTIRFIGLPDLE